MAGTTKTSTPLIELLNPLPGDSGTPFRGFASDPTEITITGMGAGIWSLSQNGRTSGGGWVSRMGGVSLVGAPPSGCTVISQGALYAPFINGVQYTCCAFSDGTNIRIYVTSDLTNWSELTQTAGFDDNNRLTGLSTNITWCVLKTPRDLFNAVRASKDVLVVSDGNVVRIWAPDDSAWADAQGIKTISAATAATPIAVTSTAHNYSTGQVLKITGGTGLSGLNGIWTITVVDGNHYTLNGSAGTGTYNAGTATTAPTMAFKHSPNLTLPTNADQYKQTATFRNYLQLANATRTYATTPLNISTTHIYQAKDSNTTDNGSTTPYVAAKGGTLPILKADSTCLIGQVAQFQSAAPWTPTTQEIMGIEGLSAASLADMLQYTRIEYGNTASNAIAISAATNAGPIQITAAAHGRNTGDSVEIFGVLGNTAANGTWVITKVDANNFTLNGSTGNGAYVSGGTVLVPFNVLYDPTSTDNGTAFPVTTFLLDASGLRATWVFDLSNQATKVQSYFRFIRVGANGNSNTGVNTILFMASGGNWNGGTGFGVSYGQGYSYTESPGFVAAKEDTAIISSFGGPTLVTASSNLPAPQLPIPNFPTKYDYILCVKNPLPGTGIFNGGLGANPNLINVYVRPASSTTGTYYYLASSGIVQPELSGAGPLVPGFLYNYSGLNALLYTNTAPFQFLDLSYLNEERTLPTSYQTNIPAAYAYFSALNRLFAARPLADGATLPSDVWWSALSYFNRFQPTKNDRNGNVDESLGFRVTFPNSETVNGLTGNSTNEGISSVYAVTGTILQQMGPRTTVGNSAESTQLANPQPVAPHGTNSIGSIVESLGSVYYIDQYSDIVKFTPSGSLYVAPTPVAPISVRKVGDRIVNLPNGRLQFVSSVALGKRIFFCYTPFNGSTNTRALVWNVYFSMWESDDLLPSGWDFASTARILDPNSSKQRFVGITASGKLFAHDENAQEFGTSYVACRLTTGWLQAENQMFLGEVTITGQLETGQSATVTRNYVETGDAWASTLPLYNPKHTSWPYFSTKDNVPTDPANGNGPQQGHRMYLDIAWNYAPGKKIDKITVLVKDGSSPSGGR